MSVACKLNLAAILYMSSIEIHACDQPICPYIRITGDQLVAAFLIGAITGALVYCLTR